MVILCFKNISLFYNITIVNDIYQVSGTLQVFLAQLDSGLMKIITLFVCYLSKLICWSQNTDEKNTTKLILDYLHAYRCESLI